MPLLTTCPDCSAKIRVSDNALGKQIKCPKCGGSFTVTAGDAPPAPAPRRPPSLRRRWPPTHWHN